MLIVFTSFQNDRIKFFSYYLVEIVYQERENEQLLTEKAEKAAIARKREIERKKQN